MTQIMELMEKRAKAWEAAKAFLNTHSQNGGMVSAEDAATYDKMEKEVTDLTHDIERLQRQEQIDKMIRDHALEQEEAALQETLAGYDALIEAVNAGLIGMGDLTGNAAFGDLSFGTAGLGALDTITSAQIAAVLGSLLVAKGLASGLSK